VSLFSLIDVLHLPDVIPLKTTISKLEKDILNRNRTVERLCPRNALFET